MDMYFKWDNDTKVMQLPVVPEEYNIEVSQNNTSVIVHNLGEVNLKGKRNLKEVSFDSFFPHCKYGFCACEPMQPYDYVKQIEEWMDNNTTLHFIITGTSVSMYCTIEAFPYGEKEIGDVHYSITLKEYRDPNARRIAKAVKTKTYQWKSGDTWGSVAKKQTGTSGNAKAIRKKNASVIKKAKKAYLKKHGVKSVKETVALVGYKVVIEV